MKKKILYISDSSAMNLGGQVSLYNLIKHLNRDRYIPIAMCPEPGPLVEFLEKNRCPVYLMELPTRGIIRFLFLFRWLFRFRTIIKEENVDMVHTDRPLTTFLASLICRMERIPIVWHARVSAPDPFFDKVNGLLVSKIIGVSDAVGNRFKRIRKVNQKYRTIYNGVDCDKFQPSARDSSFRKEIGADNGGTVVCTVAQLIPQKGLSEFVTAARHVLKQNHNVTFIIVGLGDEDYEKSLKVHAKLEEIAGDIKFLGYRQDISNILNGIDLFVLASWEHVEGFPRVVIEAMSCGKPVVGTNVSGISEAVASGSTGLLVPPQNPEALASAILEIIQYPEHAERMGAAGRQRCKTCFDVQLYVKFVEEVYEECTFLNSPPGIAIKNSQNKV